MRAHALLTLVLPVTLVCAARAEADHAPVVAPLVHVQTDKPSYRIGDTVWFRVHATPGAPDKIEVELRRENGLKIASKAGSTRPDQAFEGSFAIPEELPGGTWKIVATSGERVLHEVSLEVYDVSVRTFDLELTVLGDFAYPGEDVTATFLGRDLRGRPLAGDVGHWVARFGALTVSGTTAALDDEGRAVIRFKVPEHAQGSGSLSVGVESQKTLGAIAKPVRVFGGIARVDCFPEGGAIVSGQSQRVSVLVRGPMGDPVECEGRVVDDLGEAVDAFRTDRRGLALVEVPYAHGRSYRVAIDRPAGVVPRFPLPAPTGHARSLRVDFEKGALTVKVHGQHTTQETRVFLVTAAGLSPRTLTSATTAARPSRGFRSTPRPSARVTSSSSRAVAPSSRRRSSSAITGPSTSR